MSKTKRQDFELMRLLKVTEINRIICDTNMGVLKLRLRKGEQEYKFVLDSVELPKELHKEVYELLYAPEVPQVSFGRLDPSKMISIHDSIIETKAPVLAAKTKGRPKGSKNK